MLNFLLLVFHICAVFAFAAPPKTGYIPTPPEEARKYINEENLNLLRASAGALPSSVDHCNDLPPVGNQTKDDCVGWAVGYYYKSYQEGKEHNWDFSTNSQICSPDFVYNQINMGNDNGAYVIDALRLIVRQGCDNLTDMPYNSTDYLRLPRESQLRNAVSWRAESFSYFYYNNNTSYGNRTVPLTDGNITALKTHLNNGDIFVMAIPIYNSFLNLNSTSYFYDGPSVGESYLGGHAVVVCGYNDSAGNGEGGFKIRNSWGSTWGNNGEAYISYDFVKNYSMEAASMVDRQNYSWSRLAKFTIEGLYRSDLNATVLSGDTQLSIFGDYEYQNYNDTRNVGTVIFDVSQIGSVEEYYLKLADVRNSDNNGTLTGFYVYTSTGQMAKSQDTPLLIPVNGTSVNAYLSMNYPYVNSFNVTLSRSYAPANATFYYEVGDPNNDTLTCYFDFNGDNNIDQQVSDCSSGNLTYTYSSGGVYTALVRVSDGTYTANETVPVSVGSFVQDDYFGNATLSVGEGDIVSFTTVDPPRMSGYNVRSAYSFQVCNVTSGNVTIHLTFGSELSSATSVFKNGVNVTSNVTITSNSVSYNIVDNGPFDSNSTVGCVGDPIVIAERPIGSSVDVPAALSGSSSGGGCSTVVNTSYAVGNILTMILMLVAAGIFKFSSRLR